MSIISYNNVSGLFRSLRDELNDLLANDLPLINKNNSWTPSIDLQETDEKYIVHADLPGVESKYINVRMNGNFLVIDGERNEEKSIKDGNYSHMERFIGRFYRQVTLPVNIDANKIVAISKNGVLEITIPKIENKEMRKIEVKNA